MHVHFRSVTASPHRVVLTAGHEIHLFDAALVVQAIADVIEAQQNAAAGFEVTSTATTSS